MAGERKGQGRVLRKQVEKQEPENRCCVRVVRERLQM